jgi:CRISPR system Cascade subunit CasA
MLHTFVIGSTLLETLFRNLLNKEVIAENVVKGWGRPIWELPIHTAADSSPIENATLTYLGRLTPYSRAVRLNELGETIVLGNGLEYPIFPAYREATASIIERKEGLGLLPASTQRSIWRQLHAITVSRKARTNQAAGPLALIHSNADGDTAVWVGALITSGNGKIEDTVEAFYRLPSELFEPFGRAAYELGVEHSETIERALKEATRSYAKTLKMLPAAFDGTRQHFWTRVEQSLGDLFTVARELTPPEQLAASPWGRAVHEAAIDAYERSCPRRTPRQIQAYALGLRHLFASATPAKVAKKTKAKKSAA